MKVKMILKKSIALKLITLLFLCPFITYGMKRKRSETLHVSNNKKNKKFCIYGLTKNIQTPTAPRPSPFSAQEYTLPSTAQPSNISTVSNDTVKTIMDHAKTKYHGYICYHEKCKNRSCKTLKGLRNHIRRGHAPHYKCLLCQNSLGLSSFTEAQRLRCSVGTTGYHQVVNYAWTPERQEELLKDFGIEASSIKPSPKKNKKSINKKPINKQACAIQSITYYTTQSYLSNRQQALLDKIIETTFTKNNAYICEHNNCKSDHKSRPALKIHFFKKHFPIFKCSQCDEVILAPHLQEAKKRHGHHHNSITIGITQAEEETLIRDFGIENFQYNENGDMHSTIKHPLLKEHLNQLFQITQQCLKKNNFKCPFDECGQQLINQISIQRHFFSHIKSFKCTNCNKEFTRKAYSKTTSLPEECIDPKGHILIPNDPNVIQEAIKHLRKFCEEKSDNNTTITSPQQETITPMDIDWTQGCEEGEDWITLLTPEITSDFFSLYSDD